MDTAPISELQKQHSCTSQEYQDESQSKPFREERVSNCDSPQPNIERSIAENCTPNLKAAREAEMAMHRQQAENIKKLKEEISQFTEAQKKQLQDLDRVIKKQVHHADESHEDVWLLSGRQKDSERRQTDVMVVCGAVLFGLFLILMHSNGNEINQKMIDFSSNVQHLEERITELQHVLSAEFEKNAHLQSKLNEYEEKMQNWSDAIQNNFTHQSLNIQLSSVKTLQLKEELDQAQYSLTQNIGKLSEKFELKAAVLNKAIDEQMQKSQELDDSISLQKSIINEQQEINKQQMLVQQHLVMTLKEVKSLNGMGLYSPETIIIMPAFSQYKQNETSEWFSPPFYTHWAGYKLCLKVYPNGYGNGKRTHLSWFIYLMRGEFDDSLIWPFSGSITVQLINWNKEYTYSKEKTAEFDSNSDLTAKSRVDVGEIAPQGVGFTKFVPLKELYNTAADIEYLQNDSLKFKVSNIEVFSK